MHTPTSVSSKRIVSELAHNAGLPPGPGQLTPFDLGWILQDDQSKQGMCTFNHVNTNFIGEGSYKIKVNHLKVVA